MLFDGLYFTTEVEAVGSALGDYFGRLNIPGLEESVGVKKVFWELEVFYHGWFDKERQSCNLDLPYPSLASSQTLWLIHYLWLLSWDIESTFKNDSEFWLSDVM